MSFIYFSNADELLNEIRIRGIAVFGTGFVSERFTEGLRRYGLDDKIKCYLVTSEFYKNYKGKPVINIETSDYDDKALIDDNLLVCIAVHESNKASILRSLEKKGFREYTWIYPFFHEVCLGKPLKVDEEIYVSRLIKKCLGDYRIAVRLLAIEACYGKNKEGLDIYVKAQSAHCRYDTAIRRFEQLKSLIQNWDLNGYDNKSRLIITDQDEMIDGHHRLTLAYYHGMDIIKVNVYPSLWAKGFLNDGARITEEVLAKVGLSDREMKIVSGKHNEIVRKLGTKAE